MKHIKKRFLIESSSDKLKFEDSRFEIIPLKEGFSDTQISDKKKQVAFIETESGFIYGGFVHKLDGRNFIFPIPDPTLVYFNNAQLSLKNILNSRRELLEKVDFTRSLSESSLNAIYNYYGITSGCVIFMFTALESFINQQIPEGFEYKIVTARKTEIYNKIQIQESLDFKTKIKAVLTEVSGKDFFLNPTPTNEFIWKLKKFRDEIIHTKHGSGPLQYDELIKMSLSFQYEKVLHAVATFMNHYQSGYIIECDCGMEF